MKGVSYDETDPNYDLLTLAARSLVQRLYPTICNVEWSGRKGFDRTNPAEYNATMGCRTVTGYDVNGLGWNNDGRGNIAPQTIILPTVAMIAKEQYELRLGNMKDRISEEQYRYGLSLEFLEKLSKYIEETKDSLIDRYNYIIGQPLSVAKYIYKSGGYAGFDGKTIESALKHGTLAIGQLGLAEALQIIVGCDHTEKDGMELAHKVEGMFRDKCNEYKKKYSLNFGVYMSPSENLCYTAMKKFKERYGIIPNVSDKDFFTNSMHVPVWTKISPYEKIDIESQLTGYSSGGCITVVQFDNSMKENIPEVLRIIKYSMDHDIPYLGINTPNVQCDECGYMGDMNEDGTCPICGSHHVTETLRVTGYLVKKKDANKGKQQEFDMRVSNSLY